MAGIYLHIPFCFSRCGYCDFFKTTLVDKIPDYLQRLLLEIEYRKDEFQSDISTIYIGGGTPSLVSSNYYRQCLATINKCFNVLNNSEVTIEANPDDLSSDYLYDLIDIGFNRISIGTQSFLDYDLEQMGRRHSAKQAIDAVLLAKKCGFNNISVDLIYGLPWSSSQNFKNNLNVLKNLPITHLSAYHLTFEKNTNFFELLKQGKLMAVQEQDSVIQYQILCDVAHEMGMQHYEVSNFCYPGYISQHNSAYWDGVDYIGFGPGSHSFFNGKRRWNKTDLHLYLLKDFNSVSEEEILSRKDIFNELIMLGLRTYRGVNLGKIGSEFSDYSSLLKKRSKKWQKDGNLIVSDGYLKCTERGWLIVDAIIEDLFVVE